MASASFKYWRGVQKKARPSAPRDGRWQMDFRDRYGVRKREVCSALSEAEAVEMAFAKERIEERYSLGLAVDNGPEPTVAEVYEKQKELVYKGHSSAASTDARMRHYVLPAIGSKRLGQVTPADITAILNKAEPNLSLGSLRHIRVHISSLFNFAKKQLKVFSGPNPATDARPIKLNKRDVRHMDPQELAKLLSVASNWKFLFKLAALTGLPKDTLRRLEWSHIKSSERVVVVFRPKSKKNLVVPIHRELEADIEAERAKSTSKYVFPGRRGEMRTKTWNAVRVLRSALRKAGLSEEYTFHDLRHTWGTLFVEATGDVRAAQVIMGHESGKTTEESYLGKRRAHLIAQMDRFSLPGVTQNFLAVKNEVVENPKTQGGPMLFDEAVEQGSRIRSPTLYPIELRAQVVPDNTTSQIEQAGSEKTDQVVPDYPSSHKVGHADATRQSWAVDNEEKHSVSVRFWAWVRFAINGQCWEWGGHKNGAGYGVMKLAGNRHLAHRVAWAIEHGPTPDGMVVRHRCHNPGCVRVDHLCLGTHADNVADRVAASRSAIGERNGRSKLKSDDVAAIKEALTRGEPKADLARRFGVDRKLVWQISEGKIWKHVPIPTSPGGDR